jgi:hypothetical protein
MIITATINIIQKNNAGPETNPVLDNKYPIIPTGIKKPIKEAIGFADLLCIFLKY